MSEKKCRHCASMVPKDARICPDCKGEIEKSFIERFVDGLLVGTFGGVGFLIRRLLNNISRQKKT